MKILELLRKNEQLKQKSLLLFTWIKKKVSGEIATSTQPKKEVTQLQRSLVSLYDLKLLTWCEIIESDNLNLLINQGEYSIDELKEYFDNLLIELNTKVNNDKASKEIRNDALQMRHFTRINIANSCITLYQLIQDDSLIDILKKLGYDLPNIEKVEGQYLEKDKEKFFERVVSYYNSDAMRYGLEYPEKKETSTSTKKISRDYYEGMIIDINYNLKVSISINDLTLLQYMMWEKRLMKHIELQHKQAQKLSKK